MDIRRQRMSVEEYQLLPFHPGWKVEYMGGEAIFQPCEAFAHATLATTCRPSPPAPNGLVLQTPDESDAAALEQLFYSAFVDTPECAGWPEENFALEPAKQVRRFFSFESAAPLGASQIAVVKEPGADDGAVVGAALLHASGSAEAWLDVLMIAPAWQRRGVASMLVGDALAALAAADIHRLVSRWHLANEPSISWHQKLGFVEEPDLCNARLYYRAAQSELWRLDQLASSHRNAVPRFSTRRTNGSVKRRVSRRCSTPGIKLAPSRAFVFVEAGLAHDLADGVAVVPGDLEASGFPL